MLKRSTEYNTSRTFLQTSQHFSQSIYNYQLQIIYKTHLGYGHIPYDKAYNINFHQKMKSIQGAIRRTAKKKLSQELVKHCVKIVPILSFFWSVPYLTGSTSVGHQQLCFFNTLCRSSHLRDLLSAVQCHQPVDQ